MSYVTLHLKAPLDEYRTPCIAIMNDRAFLGDWNDYIVARAYYQRRFEVVGVVPFDDEQDEAD